jgi:hypothetical protein
MKKRLIYSLFFLGALFFICESCKNNVTNDTKEVKNATYKMYNINGEKGYNVTFDVMAKERNLLQWSLTASEKRLIQ